MQEVVIRFPAAALYGLIGSLFQNFLKPLDAADAPLAEIDLDMAGELVVDVAVEHLHEFIEFFQVLFLLFSHWACPSACLKCTLHDFCYIEITVR